MSITHGKHFFKFGGRVRGVNQENQTQSGYNGTFTFTSLAAYRTTLLGNTAGLSMAQIAPTAAAPTSSQSPAAIRSGTWSRLTPACSCRTTGSSPRFFTLSLGLRWEGQGNIHDKSILLRALDLPGQVDGSKGGDTPGEDRHSCGFGFSMTGSQKTACSRQGCSTAPHQLQFLIPSPNFFPVIPSLATLTSSLQAQAVRMIDPNLHAPMMAQMAIGVERQFAEEYYGGHELYAHSWRARTAVAEYQCASGGHRRPPYGGSGNIFAYESTGIFNQQQLMSNVNARVSTKSHCSASTFTATRRATQMAWERSR